MLTQPAGAAVDTDVVSFLFKRDPRADLYRPHMAGRILVVSFMTIAELERWALARNWGEARRTSLEEHLGQFVIRGVDLRLCECWAHLSDTARRKGRPIACADAWVAATALRHSVPLITHNGDHYEGVRSLVDIVCSPPTPV